MSTRMRMVSIMLGARFFSASSVMIKVPRSLVRISHARSSGPGGQNVNKVNTKVELRVQVRDCTWMPDDVRGRLLEQEKGRITREGDLIVRCSESRSQHRNMEFAWSALQDMVDRASISPKERVLTEKPEYAAERRLHDKKRQSDTKKHRASKHKHDDW